VTLSKIRGLKNVHTGEEIIGYVITSPLTAEQMKEDPDFARKSIIKAGRLAERKGASMIGLGALTASLTRGGLDVTAKIKSGVTTGRMYTSTIIVDTIEKAMKKLDFRKEDQMVAIVGAAGSIGTACAQILVHRGFRNLLFIDLERKKDRIDWLSEKVKQMQDDVQVEVSYDMDSLKKADFIIAVTNAPEVTIRSEYLKPGAIIVDDAQPTDVDMDVIEKRDDVLVFEGGDAHADNVHTHFNFGLRDKNDLYSCLAEAVILAGIGQTENYSVGAVSDVDFKLLKKMEEDAKKIGIHVGELQNVYRTYTQKDFDTVKKLSRK
jgi:fatty aldehyde-generating acyl-ACP reductase